MIVNVNNSKCQLCCHGYRMLLCLYKH